MNRPLYWMTIFLFTFTLGIQAQASELARMKKRIPKIISLKDKGEIGEKKDGLLGIVKSSSAAKAIVKAENKDRMSLYKKRAKKGGHKLDTFLKVMGDERIKKERKGRFIQNAAGGWVKK